MTVFQVSVHVPVVVPLNIFFLKSQNIQKFLAYKTIINSMSLQYNKIMIYLSIYYTESDFNITLAIVISV